MADAIETQTQQVTSETPATKPEKNPKRVAAGKATAEKTRLAREAQKRAAEQHAAMSADKAPAPAPPQPQPTDAASASSNAALATSATISTTQWLAIGSFVVSLIGLYYKREEIKSTLSAKGPPPPETSLTPVVPSKIPVANKNPAKGLRSMD